MHFLDFHKFVSPKIIENPIVAWIADWREMEIREDCFLKISFLAKFLALEKGTLQYALKQNLLIK